MQPNNWYVVTGGPSTGKTTLLTEFAKHGFAIVPEAARTVIDEAIAAGQSVAALRANELQFQEEVARRKAQIENELDPRTPTFFDRGMQDTTAYLEQNGLAVAPWVEALMSHSTYAGVFLLDPLPVFVKDYARVEDEGFTHEIHDKLLKAYQAAGMEPVIVPALPLQERVDFVLHHITQPGGATKCNKR